MEIHDRSFAPTCERIYLTLGVFDGIHLGHKKLLACLVKEAADRGRRSLLLTFDPHPRRLLDPQNPLLLLTSLKERLELISEQGVDGVVLLPFNKEVACMSGEDFVRKVLLRLRIEKIFIGHGYRFGREGRGDINLLREMGREHGFKTQGLLPVRRGGDAISSTRIRDALSRGEIEEAKRLLGRFPSRRGRVIPGERRGQILGYPTANLDWDRELILPMDGVYAVYTTIGQEKFSGMANIGKRPTFGEKGQRLEVHLFDFDEDIYGEEIEILFVKRIRDEKVFKDRRSLAKHLIQDEALIRKILVAKDK